MEVKELLHDNDNFYIASEICHGGDLYERMQQGKFNEYDAAYIIKQVLKALNYLHKLNIMHRDMKPENILMMSKDNKNLEVKITDFGFSSFFDPDEGLKT